MKNTELFKLAEETFANCLQTLKDKNHDYAVGDNIKTDALQNFKLVEYLKITDSSTGVLVRMMDKVSRLANVYKGGNKVKESVEDTAKDLINYTLILLATIKENGNV